MFDELKPYKDCNHFFFKHGMKLSTACNAPDMPGIYIYYQHKKGKIDLVYVGVSDTTGSNGVLKSQTLRQSLNNRQGGMTRQSFFEQLMDDKDVEAIDIYWYVTMNDKVQHLPVYAQGLILQRYFDIYGGLPPWNKEL